MKELVNAVRLKLNDTDLTEQQKLDVMSAVLDTLNELGDLKYPDDYELGYMRGYHEAYKRDYNFYKDMVEHARLQIKLGDSVGSGIHVHSQGEIYPVIQMYIGQEKVFTYANKVLPYSMKQQVIDAVADGTPAIRELFSTSTRKLYTF